MRSDRYPRSVIDGRVRGQREKGRPNKRWIDVIKEDCRELGVSLTRSLEIEARRGRPSESNQSTGFCLFLATVQLDKRHTIICVKNIQRRIHKMSVC